MAITFRSKSDEIEKKFQDIKEDLEKIGDSYGGNATLNYAINLAYEKLQELNGRKEGAVRQKVHASDFNE